MNRCSRCGQTKLGDEFAWRRIDKGQRDSYCRPCRSAYKKEHYARNKKRYMKQAQKWKKNQLLERMEWLIQYLEDHPCVDCGETDVLVLQFDHRGDEPKSFDVVQGVRSRRWPAVLAEIEKCDVRCANCHRRVTAERAGFRRFQLVQAERTDG